MHYVKQFNINSVDTKQVACIELQGKPNAATAGALGVLGIDVTSPLHDVYKCVAVNGAIYTWELLSSGMSIMSANIVGGGAESVEFPYDNLRTPAMYVVKPGDLILDKEGYLYQIDSLNNTYCVATYCGTRIVTDKSAYAYAQESGYTGTEAEFSAKLAADWVPQTRKINGKGLDEDVSLTPSDVGSAPTEHSSADTTYGVGSNSKYGHIKLSDAINSSSKINGGIAATPYAVKLAYDLANSKANAQDVQDLLVNSAKIAYGSYVGTGNSATKTLTFDFTPKLVFLHWRYSSSYYASRSDAIMMEGVNTATIYGYKSDEGNASSFVNVISYTISDKKVEMSTSASYDYQYSIHYSLNNDRVTYYYVAIG